MPCHSIPQAALDLIKAYEGKCLRAYKCPAGVWTIGYGHTGLDVSANTVISDDEANRLLLQDAARAGEAIEAAVKVPLTDNQFGALVCFVFNVGAGNFRRSTLLVLLNMGKYELVPLQLMRWNKANGAEVSGLTRRRASEAKLWDRKTEA